MFNSNQTTTTTTTPVRRNNRNSTIGLNSQQQQHSLPQLPSTTTTTNQQQPYYNHHHHHQHSESLDYSSAEHLPNLKSSTHSSEHHQQQQQQQLTNRHVTSSPKLPKSEPLQLRSYSGVLEIRMPNEPQQQQQQQQLPRNSLNNKSVLHQSSNLSLDKHHRSGNPLISSTGSTLKPRRRPPRVYETHPGNLVFCCRGRLISSKPSHSIPLTRRRRPKNRRRIEEEGSRVEDRAGEEEEEEGEGEGEREGRRLYLPLQTLASVALLLAIPILFLYSTAPTLIHRSGFGIFLLALFCYLWMLTLSSMAKTVSSDPGILPRGLDPNPEMVWKPAPIDPPASNDLPNPNLQSLSQQQHPGGGGGEKAFEYDQVGEWELLPRWIKVESKQLNPSSSNKPIPLDFLPDEDVGWIQSKWCSTCESYRPPRSSHCRMCDCCIDGIDHHCSYLNNCIGSRNYRSFFTFLMTSVMSLMMIIGCSIWKLFFELDRQQQDPNGGEGSNNSQAILDNLQRNPISIAILLLSFLLLLPISALLGYHMFLTFNGLTTVEYIKTQTTKRVLKENKKLISQIYEGEVVEGQREHTSRAEDEGGRGKRVWATLLRRLFLINPELQTHPSSADPQHNHPHPQTTTHSSHAPNHQPPPQIRRSNNFTIGRLCRPDTDPYIDWAGTI
ncbi:Eukaryotic peptide chain release factor GTP-binding subunit [Puccinia graminis f. sp. tritici]|uniref:Palmitoyltransferase n=1 Tax=Puccinia graminis f. sp. tritici TaxID=56615 RepID=A0A5B0RKB2_PUCGR|nr:Eukaryotic peptide chain release factor GTP-binding subunit [Puccinia graminis f. sp. tritici]